MTRHVKIELFIPSAFQRELIELLAQHHVTNYTTHEILSGHGARMGRSPRAPLALTSQSNDVHVVVVCASKRLDTMKGALRDFIKRRRGFGFVQPVDELLV